MAVVLTEEQQREADCAVEQPAEVHDPRTGRRYRLVPAEEYEELKDRLEQDAWRTMASRNLARRLAEEEAGEE